MNLIIFLSIWSAVFIVIYIFIASGIPFLVKLYNDWQIRRTAKISSKLEDSYIFLEKRKQALVYFLPFIFAGAGFLIFTNPIGAIPGFIVGLAFPTIITKMAAANRVKKFQSQLVDSLMILSSSLKGGLSFIQAMEVLVEEMPAPISQEFSAVLKENRLSVSLEESLRSLRKRMPLEEVNLLISSVLVARETGGDLTRVFARLTETIRDNIKLKEKIATMTLQGKLQGIIMSILPVVFTYFIYRSNPGHFDVMLETSLGRMLLGAAVIAQIVGMILIKKISTIKI